MKNPDRSIRKPQANSIVTGSNSTATQRQEITDRERTDLELRRLRRALGTISQCNRAVVRARSEQELLDSVCRTMVDAGGYRMAWVGVGNRDRKKTISPVTHAGFEGDCLKNDKITWADTDHGRGPAGTAIRTGKTAIARNIQTDPNMVAWRDEALKRGYASSIALPILLNDQVFGTLVIYSEEADAFDSAEVQLLTELTEDLAYGIQSLRTRIESANAEEALRNSEAKFRAIVENSRDGILFADAENVIVYRSFSYQSINGFTDEERLGHVGYETVHPDDVAALRRAWQLIVANPGKTYEIADYRIRHKNGTWKWVESSATNLLANPHVGAIVVTTRDLTERRRAEEALRESEARFRTLSDHALVGINILQDDRYIYVNPAYAEIFGYKSDELIGLDASIVVHPDDRELSAEQRRRRLNGELPTAHFEFRGVRKDGETREIEVFSTRTTLYNRPAIIANLLDITERKQAEQALRKSEAALKEALLAAQMGVWSWTVATDTVVWDENLFRIAGRDVNLSAPNYQEHSQCYTRESWERLKAAVENALATGTPYVLDLEMLRSDGSKRWVIGRGEPVQEASGKVTQLRGTVQDITDRTQTEQRVRESEEKFRKAFMTGADAYYIAALSDGKTVEVNESGKQVFGYTREEMIGKSALELELYADPIDRQKMVSEVKAQGYVKNLELRGRKKGGEIYDALLSVNLLEGVGDDEPLILGVARDITEQKQAERALRESEARLKEAEKLAQLGSSSWEVATDTTTWSDELYRIVGRDPRLPPPKHSERAGIYTPESWERLEIAVRHALATGEPYDLELEVVHPDGTKRHVHARGVAEHGPDGNIVRLHGTLQDVTERHQLEQQFRQVQKMEAVGRLAGGVAHDFNNLLTVINGYSEMALEAMGLDDAKRAYISEVRKAGERAAGLTGQLLAFSRQQVLAPRILNLDSVIVDMEKMLRRLIGEDVGLTVAQGHGLGQVKADPGQIEQIIMNLVINARDAMPHGGKLAIATTNTELDENDIDKAWSVVRGHYVMLAVSDNGTGMDAQTQAHIFEPFFTTKEQGKGTGLGLATVYGIVKQSGGYISVHSVPGEGTTFNVYLPRVDEPAKPFIPAEGVARPGGGSETILLVEDEIELRTLAVRALQTRGYRVLESASPEEALQINSEEQGPIHLLLTDVVMPGMNGRKVAEQIAPLRPNMKVLYMSGYTDDSVFRNGVLETGSGFLQKPFTPSSLARKVRAVLDAHKPA